MPYTFKRIKEIAEIRGMSIKQVAEHAGLGVSTVYRLVSGVTYVPYQETIFALGMALQVDPLCIYGYITIEEGIKKFKDDFRMYIDACLEQCLNMSDDENFKEAIRNSSHQERIQFLVDNGFKIDKSLFSLKD